jgi:hypothetical protein
VFLHYYFTLQGSHSVRLSRRAALQAVREESQKPLPTARVSKRRGRGGARKGHRGRQGLKTQRGQKGGIHKGKLTSL